MRFEKRIRALEAKIPNPVVLFFADGSMQKLSGGRDALFDLFSGVCGGDFSPAQTVQLDLVRTCIAAEEPGGGRMVELIWSLMDAPGDGIEVNIAGSDCEPEISQLDVVSSTTIAADPPEKSEHR